MALMMMTAVGPKLPLQRNKSRISRVMVPISLKATLSRTTERANACNVWEGLEASISDPSKNDIRLDNVKIVIESRDNDKITVPKSFLLQMLGRDRVTKFLIQEIVGITIGDYENLKVKSQFKTIQTAEELEAAFTPGSEFGFNAVILPLTQEKEAVSEFASTRAAINTLRWFIWSYLPQYKSRLVFDDLPQQCADECVACSGRVDLFDGVGLDAAMEILDPRKPAKSVYLGVVLASLLPEGDEEELQTRAPESHGDFVFHRLRAGEELQLDVAHLDDVGLVPDAQDLLPGLRRRRPQRQPEVGVVGEQGSCFLCRPHGLQMSGSTWLRDQAYRSVVKDRGL
ncbi:Bacterial trigger factor protein (TF) [Musa troglodytarum]|uniref:Bacterial trigger factor protein (TF) n=1 Tax=Musa troglodytarum TaxID=320322 RepID=A0A9E7EVJ9_9LILI|nr:Bacterial trigger factor protein (TF) [Musa troglodytarum]